MIDIKFLRENPDVVRASQTARGEDAGIVDHALAADDARRIALSEFEALRAEQNALSKLVGSAKGDEKNSLLENAKNLANSVKEADSKRSELEEQAKNLVMQLSNVLDPAAPIGKEEDFVVIEHVGTPRSFDFEAKDHVELGKLLGAIDTERGAKVAGSRSYYLTGSGAMLEFALVNYAIASALKAGFTPVIPPVLVNPPAMEGTGFLGQAAENVYHLEKDDVYLVGTSEVPLAAYHMDEVLPAEKLPLRYAGYSSCFRREAGTYGKDTRGIIRVHQFDKVEMFSFCHPDQAIEEHKRLLGWEKDFLNAMEIPYRVIDVASGDLGSSANRKFDIEAWIPTQNAYREVTSTSNCTEFQARRLNIRFKDAEGTKVVATLNGTLVAIPRMIVAILENHQNSDGSVNIPKALQPFLGKERFELV
ncbi:MAG: serine--tRNA ligase [Actinobacteria bacterium]|uniref:serine--tRNA ligase n=1 Tax=freshwater metagenome TaxID=449393 RepID=A0A6J7SMQ5_9ZZZZ|nr:serine--tRNA ligase [Actinomycetota bacterium]MSY36355.1 serine--tRNA ligase [Actinomycetota bacterium]MTA72973.1 serine--tRNA ligase [Actinomycetota bacterium]MTB29650.1 serine--tRNA ligase [Actinomycetota bacterium]MUH49077.1 serine--tRNA ligase [Actinomycetota bacterium]